MPDNDKNTGLNNGNKGTDSVKKTNQGSGQRTGNQGSGKSYQAQRDDDERTR